MRVEVVEYEIGTIRYMIQMMVSSSRQVGWSPVSKLFPEHPQPSVRAYERDPEPVRDEMQSEETGPPQA